MEVDSMRHFDSLRSLSVTMGGRSFGALPLWMTEGANSMRSFGPRSEPMDDK